MYYYNVYEMVFAAEMEFPEFSGVAVDSVEKPDVVIRRGGVAEKLENAQKIGVSYQLGRNALQLDVEGIARYLARDAGEIIIDQERDAPMDAVRSLLLDAPLTGVLHQRGMLPFYGGAVQVDDHCILFCGISGNGKSTAVREFMKRGYKLLTDDLAVVAEQNGALVVLPGYPSQRLPVDVIRRSVLDPGDYPRVRPGIHQRRVAVSKKDWAGKKLPLKKIYIMTTWNESGLELEELDVDDLKFNLLHDSMHRQYLSGMSTGFALVKLTSRLMNETPCARITQTKIEKDIDKMIEMLEEDMGK